MLSIYGGTRFTERQRQVVQLIAAGCSNVEIAERLGVSPRTAKAHSDVLRTKLGVSRRRQIPRRLPRSDGGRPPREPRDGSRCARRFPHAALTVLGDDEPASATPVADAGSSLRVSGSARTHAVGCCRPRHRSRSEGRAGQCPPAALPTPRSPAATYRAPRRDDGASDHPHRAGGLREDNACA